MIIAAINIIGADCLVYLESISSMYCDLTQQKHKLHINLVQSSQLS